MWRLAPPQEPNAEDIALKVIHEQEVEVEAELVEPPEGQEVENQIIQNITEELISEVVVYEYVKTRICNNIQS